MKNIATVRGADAMGRSRDEMADDMQRIEERQQFYLSDVLYQRHWRCGLNDFLRIDS